MWTALAAQSRMPLLAVARDFARSDIAVVDLALGSA